MDFAGDKAKRETFTFEDIFREFNSILVIVEQESYGRETLDALNKVRVRMKKFQEEIEGSDDSRSD